MSIEFFRFEVRPIEFYGREGGMEKVLNIQVQVDGQKYAIQRICPAQRPYESEIEYYTRLATSAMEQKLKEIQDINEPS